MDNAVDRRAGVVGGRLSVELLLMDPVATQFFEDAEKEERELSPHARYCIKKYYEFKVEMERFRKVEEEFKKLREEHTRLQRFLAGPADGSLSGPDFRVAPAKPGLQENAG